MADVVNAQKAIQKLWRARSTHFSDAFNQILEHIEAFRALPIVHLEKAVLPMNIIYHFLLHLYVDNADHFAYVVDKSASPELFGYHSIIAFMQQQSSKNQFHRFCRVYAELLSRVFMQTLCRTFNNPIYSELSQAREYFYTLSDLGNFFRNTPEYARFSTQLQRYNNLLNSLEVFVSKAHYA